MTTPQQMPNTDTTLTNDTAILAGTGLQARTSTVGGINVSAGVDGFRPAVRASVETSSTGIVDRQSAGASATYSLGNRASISAYGNYELGDRNGAQLRLGISAEYNNRSGFSAAAGARADYNVGGIQPYASVITRVGNSDYGARGTTVEAGACADVSVTVPRTGNNQVDAAIGAATGGTNRAEVTVCAGVQHNSQGTRVVIGLGKTF
jgi:hypothetical protein